MKHKKDTDPYNEKGERHGYRIRHHINGELWYEGLYVNGVMVGLWINYDAKGKVKIKKYYI